MIVKIGKLRVDVLDGKCPDRDCYQLGFDKGSFSVGRGYTSYHTDAKGRRIERLVCQTRHLHGCPVISVCPVCRRCHVNPAGAKCRCGGITEASDES